MQQRFHSLRRRYNNISCIRRFLQRPFVGNYLDGDLDLRIDMINKYGDILGFLATLKY